MRAALVLAAFLALTLMLMPLQVLLRSLSPRAALTLQHHYWRMVARLLGMRVTLTGILPATGPLLIVANHVSWLDIIALSALRPVSFIAKGEVASWPLFGALARLGGSIFIDRTRRGATGPAAARMRQRLAAGEALVLFAEGTSSTGEAVLPFRSSLFAAADAAAHVTVCPLALSYRARPGQPAPFAWTGDMTLLPHLLTMAAHGPFEARLAAGPPLSLQAHGDRKALTAAAEAAVRQQLAGLLSDRQML